MPNQEYGVLQLAETLQQPWLDVKKKVSRRTDGKLLNLTWSDKTEQASLDRNEERDQQVTKAKGDHFTHRDTRRSTLQITNKHEELQIILFLFHKSNLF